MNQQQQQLSCFGKQDNCNQSMVMHQQQEQEQEQQQQQQQQQQYSTSVEEETVEEEEEEQQLPSDCSETVYSSATTATMTVVTLVDPNSTVIETESEQEELFQRRTTTTTITTTLSSFLSRCWYSLAAMFMTVTSLFSFSSSICLLQPPPPLRTPQSELQRAIHRSRRRRRLRSVRFWLMVCSALLIVIITGYYCYEVIKDDSTQIIVKQEDDNDNGKEIVVVDYHTDNNDDDNNGHNHKVKLQEHVYITKLNKISILENLVIRSMDGKEETIFDHNLRSDRKESTTWTFGIITREPTTEKGKTKRASRNKHVMTNFFPGFGISKNDDTDDDDNNDKDTRKLKNTTDSVKDGGPFEKQVIRPHRQREHDTIPNPSIYGWTPSAYPNPRTNPLRCGISYILKAHQEQLQDDKNEDDGNDSDKDIDNDTIEVVRLENEYEFVETAAAAAITTTTTTTTTTNLKDHQQQTKPEQDQEEDEEQPTVAEIVQQQPNFAEEVERQHQQQQQIDAEQQASTSENNSLQLPNSVQPELLPQPPTKSTDERNQSVFTIKNDNEDTINPLEEADEEPILRLCDPDWMLGGLLLEEVAASMYNFSDIFSVKEQQQQQQDGTAADGENDKPWDIAIGRPNYNSRKSIFVDAMKKLGWMKTTEASPYSEEVGKESKADYDGHNQAQQQGYEQVIPISTGQLNKALLPPVELAVACVRKMNLLSVLRQGSYYAYEDQDDMVSDAAQIFARTLHDAWWNDIPESIGSSTTRNNSHSSSSSSTSGNRVDKNGSKHHPGDYGILLFLSIQDRICFISTGSAVQHVLPWWRLDHIVASMKPDLRHQQYGTSIVAAINDLTNMLLAGPPSISDRFHDFITRFGVVIAFAAFTFVFGAWGEYRDRRKRWQYAEQRSKLSDIEREKALQLQKEYNSRCCPICLDNFDFGDSSNNEEEDDISMQKFSRESVTEESTSEKNEKASNQVDLLRSPLFLSGSPKVSSIGLPPVRCLTYVDKYGVPLRGCDGKKIKILRCGHIFCETCWKSWVHSGCGNPCNCPVCRQDVGKTQKGKQNRRRHAARSDSPGSQERITVHTSFDDELQHRQEHQQQQGETAYQSIDGPTNLLPNMTASYDSIVEHSGTTTNTTTIANNILDTTLVGGGPSFLVFYNGNVPINSIGGHRSGSTEGERTPLLSGCTNVNEDSLVVTRTNE